MNIGNETIVGLDIGTTKIACFIGKRNEDGKIKIIGFGKTESKGVERGVVKNIKDTAKSITTAVEMAQEQAGIEVKEVYVGIAGQHIKSIETMGTVMIPPDHKYILQEDVDRLIDEQHNINLNPGEDIIHIFPQNFVVDGEELGIDVRPVGVAGKQLKSSFHIVTGNTMNLLNIYDSVERAGLMIKNVVLEPIASACAVLDQADRDAGVALVDIGGGTTDIAIFSEGIIRHTSVLAVAGNYITNSIKEDCKILRSQAENLKTRFGSCLPQNVKENDIISIPGLRTQPPREISMRTLAEIIKERTQVIIDQIDFEIKESHLKDKLIAGLVLTGGGAMLRHIKELTEFNTKIDTRIGLPNEHLALDSEPEIINTMYATGIGLVIYGFMELDEERRHEMEMSDSGTPNRNRQEPKHEEEPEQTIPSNVFDDLPPITETTTTETEHRDTPHTDTTTNTTPGTDEGRRGGFVKMISKTVEKYFNKVFNDSNISNEGQEQRDI